MIRAMLATVLLWLSSVTVALAHHEDRVAELTGHMRIAEEVPGNRSGYLHFAVWVFCHQYRNHFSAGLMQPSAQNGIGPMQFLPPGPQGIFALCRLQAQFMGSTTSKAMTCQ